MCIFFPSFQSVNLTPLVSHLPLEESPSILCTQNGQGGSLVLLLPPNHLFSSSFPSFLDPGLAFSPPQNLSKPPLALFLHFECLQSRVTKQYSPRLINPMKNQKPSCLLLSPFFYHSFFTPFHSLTLIAALVVSKNFNRVSHPFPGPSRQVFRPFFFVHAPINYLVTFSSFQCFHPLSHIFPIALPRPAAFISPSACFPPRNHQGFNGKKASHFKREYTPLVLPHRPVHATAHT